ncbi:MAG: 50S ribosomal protein L25/general stress protein Ctc, partial [Stellaceae bacterium]
MPEIATLSAALRAQAGKGAARATRRMGRVPGIIYGDNQDPLLISL